VEGSGEENFSLDNLLQEDEWFIYLLLIWFIQINKFKQNDFVKYRMCQKK
jgi:hypothetical protein